MDGQIPLSVELPPPLGVADNETLVNIGHAPTPENLDSLEPLANPLNLGPADGGVELSPIPYRVLDPNDPGGPPPRLDQPAGNGVPSPGAHTPTAPNAPRIGRGGGLSRAQRENWERGVSPPRMENPINIPPIDNSPVERDPYSVWVDQLLDKSKKKKGKGKSGKKRRELVLSEEGAGTSKSTNPSPANSETSSRSRLPLMLRRIQHRRFPEN